MSRHDLQLRQIGVVRSGLRELRDCQRQESEGATTAWIEIDPDYAAALEGLEPGVDILVLTWLHLADRSRLKVHPRGDPKNPIQGVFATRSPHRPNPIGLHRTSILSVEGPNRLQVRPLEVLDDTPVVDIKSALSGEQ
jgi:tRNA-Thr(GGU) m(6)t(6)A37 methyltransferase TsaA